MKDSSDPAQLARLRLRRRLLFLILVAIILIALLIWTTIAVLDANGIDAFDAIAQYTTGALSLG